MLGVKKVNNLADVLSSSKKIHDQKQKHLELLDKKSRRVEIATERQKLTFLMHQKNKHDKWWNSDNFVRGFVKADIEDTLRERLVKDLNERKLYLQYRQPTLPQMQNKNRKSKIKESSVLKKQEDETENILKNVNKLEFPELKDKLLKVMNDSKVNSRINRHESLHDNIKMRNHSKQFMECVERFLYHNPYSIENRYKLMSENQLTSLRDLIQKKEKLKLVDCEKKFNEILSGF
jgi:hypothetical protein